VAAAAEPIVARSHSAEPSALAE
jgi:hypothetical protein